MCYKSEEVNGKKRVKWEENEGGKRKRRGNRKMEERNKKIRVKDRGEERRTSKI